MFPKWKKPEFGPRQDTNSADFDFKNEIELATFPAEHQERSYVYARSTEQFHQSGLQ